MAVFINSSFLSVNALPGWEWRASWRTDWISSSNSMSAVLCSKRIINSSEVKCKRQNLNINSRLAAFSRLHNILNAFHSLSQWPGEPLQLTQLENQFCLAYSLIQKVLQQSHPSEDELEEFIYTLFFAHIFFPGVVIISGNYSNQDLSSKELIY